MTWASVAKTIQMMPSSSSPSATRSLSLSMHLVRKLWVKHVGLDNLPPNCRTETTETTARTLHKRLMRVKAMYGLTQEVRVTVIRSNGLYLFE